MSNAIFLFVKYPESDRVKKRLAVTLATEAAAAIYCELAFHRLPKLRDLDTEEELSRSQTRSTFF